MTAAEVRERRGWERGLDGLEKRRFALGPTVDDRLPMGDSVAQTDGLRPPKDG